MPSYRKKLLSIYFGKAPGPDVTGIDEETSSLLNNDNNESEAVPDKSRQPSTAVRNEDTHSNNDWQWGPISSYHEKSTTPKMTAALRSRHASIERSGSSAFKCNSPPPLPARRPSQSKTNPSGKGSDAKRAQTNAIQHDLEEATSLIHDAMVNILERGELMDDLQWRAGNLDSSADVFRQRVTSVTHAVTVTNKRKNVAFKSALCCLSVFLFLALIVLIRRRSIIL